MRFENAALVLVDFQNDFCPGGPLAVKDGDKACAVAMQLLPLFDFVVATQDWHPVNHCSFQDQGGPWPPHCVADTRGAALCPCIDPQALNAIIRKGTDPAREAYSGFDGADAQGTPLETILRSRGITTLFVAGLATDYCVKATALDARQRGFDVRVITDAVAAVNARRGDGDRALAELKKAGVRLVTSKELLAGK